MNPSSASKQIRKKAVWGRSLTIGLLAAFFAVVSSPAEAQHRGSSSGSGSNSSGSGSKSAAKLRQHHKLDQELNRRADGNGETDVIVEFYDDRQSAERIRNRGGSPGRKLRLLKAHAARIPNSRSEERRVGKECRSRWAQDH